MDIQNTYRVLSVVSLLHLHFMHNIKQAIETWQYTDECSRNNLMFSKKKWVPHLCILSVIMFFNDKKQNKTKSSVF